MYFKILPITDTKYTDMGMIEITASFYLEPKDVGYAEYVAEHQWYDEVAKKDVLNPFCNHSIQFDYTVTLEEILYCFEWALALTHQNYLKKDLCCKADGRPVNLPFDYRKKKKEGATKSVKVLTRGKVDVLKSIDFAKLDISKDYKVK